MKYEIRDPERRAMVTGKEAMLLFIYNSKSPDKVVAKDLDNLRKFRVHAGVDGVLMEPLKSKQINLLRRRGF